MNSNADDYFYDSTDGLRLYGRRYPAQAPAGVPALCLPGLTRNSRDFAKLAAHLSARREVMALDLRGRGRSAWDADPTHYQLPTYVGDVWSLIESRGLPRVVVVGTSLGALIGLGLAAMQPERIAGLVLNDAGPEIDPKGLRRIAGYAGKLPAVSSWAEAAAQAKSVYGAPGNLWPLFAKITGVPMLVIRGALSDLLSAATVARMVREKPEVRELTVANRGHTPLLDEPECLAAIDAFLGDVDDAPRR